ncbi:hypothetical protein SUGI_0606820 [Cryptomeria japonica]|uniref:uncharacterized protein LOC131069834 n=1 Tax=Cryptomeria japonica TaxID=3369 RepID=UPI0024148248|nr:uncharacterized protein LOC131069834 [Cryptomeria japonica]GLJ30643.1 hypothetical protein SUGI_0606820 [Cryptomeria japonica]
MEWFLKCLVVATLAFLVSSGAAYAFRSDELQDDEEWGLVGGQHREGDFVVAPSKRKSSSRTVPQADNIPADSRIQFPFQHAFGNSDFTPAGHFTARSKASTHGGQTLTKVRITRNALTESEQKAFEELLKEDDFYRIRVPANVLTPGEDYVLSSIKARCLAKSNLEERFIIHMEGVNVIAVTYGSAGECPHPRLLKFPSRWSFSSHIVLKSSEQASRMPTITEDLLVNEGGVEGDDIPKPPEKSFWAKYWMYLVPLGLIVMNAVTQAMNMPEEQAVGQASAGQSSSQGPQRIANSGVRRR